MVSKFNIGDPVWAKMKGFSPWPGKIVNPTKDVKRPALKKPMQCIFFFGTNNYAWIQEDCVMSYEENKDKYKTNKSTSFKEALEAIEDYVKNRPEQPVKTADLPSIDEEIATIFSNGSTSKDASKTPVQGDTKVVKPPPSSEPTEVKANSTSPKPKPQKEKDSSTKDKLPKDAKKVAKRRTSETSSTSSVSSKRPKAEKSSSSSSNTTTPPSNSLNSQSGGSPTFFSSSLSYTNAVSTPKPNILRQTYVTRPVTPPLDIERVSETLKQKNVHPSNLKFGFLGLGIMGQGMVKNLINSGHQVTVWNRTPSKCRDFVKAGATKGMTPADVVAASDVTFCCVANPHAAKEMVFGNCGVLQEIRANKGYVEMTSIDPETSQDIAEAIVIRGGRYLEAPVVGSKKPAEDGTLIILTAGDRTLFNDCTSCFQAMGKHAFYLGDVGNGSKMNLIINMILGTTLAGLAEAMALADRAELSQKDLLEIIELGSLNCPAILEKGQAIIEGTFGTNMPLQHMQKDLCLALSVGDQLEQPLPLTATANEVFKHAKRNGYAEHDVSAVYIRTRL